MPPRRPEPAAPHQPSVDPTSSAEPTAPTARGAEPSAPDGSPAPAASRARPARKPRATPTTKPASTTTTSSTTRRRAASTPGPSAESPTDGEPTPNAARARPRTKRRSEGQVRPGTAGNLVALAEPETASGPSAAEDAQSATREAEAPGVEPADSQPGTVTSPAETAADERSTGDATSEAVTSTTASATAPPESAAASDTVAPTTSETGQDTVEVSPATSAASEPERADQRADQGGEPAGRPDRNRLRILVGVAGAAVLLVAVAVLLGVGAFTARRSGPLANQAFVDTAATAELVGQVTNAMTTVYSYNYATLPANEAAAKAVITGKFADEFARVFQPVKQLAPQEQAVLKSAVPAAGVLQLQGDRARLLMMVNQAGVRGTDKQPTGATARLVVDAQQVDGQWKIAGVTPE
jgi:Mce-associated membrane protein